MPARKRNKERDRLASSLASSLPDSGGSYQISSSFSGPERRRLLGPWALDRHTVEGRPYIDGFARAAVRGAELLEPSYASVYDFREAVCVKTVLIGALVDLPQGRVGYLFRMSVAISWELGRGCLLVRPELGYQSTSLDGQPAAVKEFSASGERMRIAYRFEEGALVLEEGADFKRLTRRCE